MTNRNVLFGELRRCAYLCGDVQFQDIADRLLSDRTGAELTRSILAVRRLLGLLAGTHAPVAAERVRKVRFHWWRQGRRE